MKTRLSMIILIIAGFLSVDAQVYTWSEDTLSYARSGMSAITIDDTIFYSGGKKYSVTFSTIWDIYDLGEDQWETYETSSNPRWNSATVSAGGKVFSAGGSNYPSWDNFDDVDIYDKETGEWTVASLSLGRTITGGAVASGNKVFFAGGHIHNQSGPMIYTNVIDIYDTENNIWLNDTLSIPRGFIGGVAAGGKVYFAGGATGEQAVTNRIDIYNMETGEWTIDSLSEARAFIAAIAYGDKIYFAGGSKPYSVTSTLIEVYNIADSIWEDPMNLQTTRVVTVLNVENSLIFTGVCDYFNLTGVINIGPSNGVVEIYYPEINQWEYSVTNLNPARLLYAPISYGNKAYYAGGWISAMTDKISILEYTGQCLPEGISFSTQEEIDNFQINYPGCTEIEGDVNIGYFSPNGTNINNLEGLSTINTIGGDLTIICNDIPNFSGLDNLVSVGGSLEIHSNHNITNMTGFENLVSVGLELGIHNSNGLQDLSGLENLSFIGGSLTIGIFDYGNPSLSNIQSLEGLLSIGGSLEINSNDILTSLEGLENITVSSISDLLITYNASLTTCEIQSICDYLDGPNGTIEIHDNAPGCNSQQDVEDACWNNVEEIGINNQFTISPNPNSGFINLRLVINAERIVICDLLNISGVKVMSLINEMKKPGTHEMEIDLNDLPAGVYFCVLKTNNGIQTKKIVKL